MSNRRKKKTEYALITQQQFDDMRAAIQEYQQQHAEAHEQLRDEQNPFCGCKACQYARDAKVPVNQTFAPIFIPYDIPWHES